jgi:response regulator RpfG family c-di-GMP phosphodiesterase
MKSKSRPNHSTLHIALPQEAHRLMINPRPVVDACYDAVRLGLERDDVTPIRRWIDGLVTPIPITALETCLSTVIAHFTAAADIYGSETDILARLSATARAHLALAKSLTRPDETVRRAQVLALAQVIGVLNPGLATHGENVGNFSRRLAIAVELDTRDINTVEYAGRLIGLGCVLTEHDLPTRQLPITAIDRKSITCARNLIRTVTAIGDIAHVLGYLHEWMDGSGPEGFLRHEIPIASRILAIAHAFAEAIVIESNTQFAVRKLIEHQGRHYDDDLVSTFLQLIGYRRSLATVDVHHAN